MMACQEILTKKSAVSQETLIKTLLPQKQPIIKQRIRSNQRDMVLMKRKALALTFILAFLISAMAGTKLVNWAKANPWMGTDWVSPADDTKPPTLTIMSPQKNIVYNSNNVTLSFNAHIGLSTATYMRLMQVYYKTDWEQNETYVYNNEGINIPYEPNAITEFSYNMNLTGVQEGKHYITVHAVEWGAYIDGLFVHMFRINGSSSVNFAIDVSPSVSVLSLVNKTYDFSDVPLYFTVSEPVSQMAYSLDGKENISIAGNMTLTGLANGDHNLTIYAKDETGNTGVSETIYFSVEVPEPFPTILVATASGASVAIIGIGLLVYFKKRKR
jgi:hypothetical protein